MHPDRYERPAPLFELHCRKLERAHGYALRFRDWQTRVLLLDDARMKLIKELVDSQGIEP